MNNKVSKKLRKLFNVDSEDPIVKRVYRKAKKEYKKLNEQGKKEFINHLNTVQNYE